MVMLHIKLKGITNAVTYKQIILSLHKPSTPWLESKVKTFFFSSESSYMYVAYQINGNGA